MKRALSTLAALISGGLLLTGCGNLVSSPALMQQTVVERTLDPSGAQQVNMALNSLDALQNYALKAQIQEVTGRYVHTVNFFGTVVLPSHNAPTQIQMDETIGGSNYPVYQNGSFAYYRDVNRWKPMQPVTDLQPWSSLAEVIAKNPPKQVYQLPDQTVVSWLCHVYQFKTMDLGALNGSKGIVKPHEALYTVWVDTTDGMLRQIQVQSTVGIPGIGTGSITSTEMLFNFNAKVDIPVPSDLIAQIEKP